MEYKNRGWELSADKFRISENTKIVLLLLADSWRHNKLFEFVQWRGNDPLKDNEHGIKSLCEFVQFVAMTSTS